MKKKKPDWTINDCSMCHYCGIMSQGEKYWAFCHKMEGKRMEITEQSYHPEIPNLLLYRRVEIPDWCPLEDSE